MNSTEIPNAALSAFAPSTIGFALIIFTCIAFFWSAEVVAALRESGITTDKEQLLPVADRDDHTERLERKERKALHNAVYKRWGGGIVAFGLIGGFGPSITKWISEYSVTFSREPCTSTVSLTSTRLDLLSSRPCVGCRH